MSDNQPETTPAETDLGALPRPTETTPTHTAPAGPAPAAQTPPPAPNYRPIPPKQPSTFKRGFGAGFGAMLGAGLVIVALSIISMISMIAGAAAMLRNVPTTASAASTTYDTIWGPADAANTIRAIDITGTIYGEGGTASLLQSGTYGYEIADQIDSLNADDSSGLLLLMNTPGGTIYGARAIADSVARYQERTGHKVVAYVQGMSASGGMYAMAGADEIIADHGTLVGSIGVIMGPFTTYHNVTGTTGTILESGVTTTGGITSEYLSAGTGKDFGNSWRDMTEAERANYQHGIDVEYDNFVNWVAAGREIPADKIKNEIGAFMFDPQTAIDKGLIDSTMGRQDAFRRAAELNGVDPDNTRVVKPAMPGMLSSLLGAETRVYGHNAIAKSADAAAPNPLCSAVSSQVLAYEGDLAAICK